MIIVNEDNFHIYNEKKAIALGNFDGVHLGHKALIKRTIHLANLNNIKSSVFTFNQHTLKIICPEKMPKLLTTRKKKINELSKLGLDYSIFFEFDKAFSMISPEDFISEVLIKKLNMKIAIVGGNYTFGYKAIGNVELLKKLSKKYNYMVDVLNPIIVDNKIVSSSYIRQLIESGELEDVYKFLGRYYSLEGVIVNGKKIGKKLGFPTANLKIESNNILPPDGVYLSRVRLENSDNFLGLTNIGNNPTFGNNNFTIETFIINFNDDIYNKHMEVEFIKKIRDEIKFNNKDELIEQMKKDLSYAMEYKTILHC